MLPRRVALVAAPAAAAPPPPGPSNVRVIVRLRPRLPSDRGAECVAVRGHSVLLHDQLPRGGDAVAFKFDSVHNERATQSDVFERDIEPNLPRLFAGFNSTVFAYGATSTGKGSPADPGVIPRVMQWLLAHAQTDCPGARFAVSYLELYQERVRDLLGRSPAPAGDLPIREDARHTIVVPDLHEEPVHSAADFARVYAQGCANRATAATRLNQHSSRSHAVLLVKVRAPGGRTAKLHLIDLAGSEDNRRTQNSGVRLSESAKINTSLFVLAKVVTALNRGDARVPYRDSKLTRLLQDSLGGGCFTCMVATIAPAAEYFSDTLNCLNFSTKSKNVVNMPVQQPQQPPPADRSDRYLQWLDERAAKRTAAAGSAAAGAGGGAAGARARAPGGGAGVEAAIQKEVSAQIAALKRSLVAPWLRRQQALPEDLGERIEQLERRLLQRAPRASSRPAALAHALAPPPQTPCTAVRECKALVLQAREAEDRGNFELALKHYLAARPLIGGNNVKLERKIEAVKLALRAEEESKIRALMDEEEDDWREAEEEEEEEDEERALATKKKRKAAPPRRSALADITSAEKRPRLNSNLGGPLGVPAALQLSLATTAEAALATSPTSAAAETGALAAPPSSPFAEQKLLDIVNAGDLRELLKLAGVGTKRAQAILLQRKESPFASLQDLRKIGFGDKGIGALLASASGV